MACHWHGTPWFGTQPPPPCQCVGYDSQGKAVPRAHSPFRPDWLVSLEKTVPVGPVNTPEVM